PLLFPLLAPLRFSPAPCRFFPCRCFRLFGGRFRRLELSAQLRFQARPFRPGSLGSAGALAQPLLQFFASPLGFSRCLLRRGQPAAEFLALFLQIAPFLFKLLAPLGFFPAGCLRLRCRCFRPFVPCSPRLPFSAQL